MNTVQLIGRLTKDIDLKFTSSGTAVGTFTLAVNRAFTNESGEREADFLNCVIWRKSAETLAGQVKKGSQLGVVGRLQTRNYENQQGQKVYVTEVVISNYTLIGSRDQNSNQSGKPSNNQSNTQGSQSQHSNQNNNQYNKQYNNQNNSQYQNQNDTQYNNQNNNQYQSQNQYNNQSQYGNQSQNNFNPNFQNPGIDINEDDLPF